MIFREVPLAEARGATLAHSMELGGRRFAKGATVGPALIAAATTAGHQRLWVARAEPGDVPEAEAAARIAALLAGDGVEASSPAHGRVNLHAVRAGLLHFDPRSIGAANAVVEAVGISTRAPGSPVSAGELVATVKIIPYALSAAEMQAVEAAGLQLICVKGWRPGLSATLWQTQLQNTADKLLEKTARVTRARLERLGVALEEMPSLPHAVRPLADALRASGAPLQLVAGATATSDRRDVIPAAILEAGGELLRVGMPVDPGNLLMLGRIDGSLVIGLPGCARSSKRNGLDLVLERWAAGLELTAAGIAAMGVGGLLEGSGRPVPWAWD